MAQAKKKTAKASKTSTARKKVATKSAAASTKKTSKKTTAKTAAGAAPKKKPVKKKAASATVARTKKAAPKAKAAQGAAENALPAGFQPYTPKKGEEYMSEGQQDHFRGLLRSWKRELMEEVDRTVHHMQDEAANFPDPNDRATQESEFSLELRARDRERKLIKKIDEALTRIDNGEYGYCDSCGIEIGIRRLEARPTATLCIDCKTLDEIREKQMG
jgi:DnaK suppressor protein